MRYVSLVLIVFTMWWTWSVIEHPSLLPEDTHVGIQDDLKRVITEYLQQNLESVKNIKFDKFWTQTMNESSVKATFSYSFEDASAENTQGARVGVAGHAILNRQKDDGGEFDVWSLDELYIDSNDISFKDGLLVSPDGKDTGDAATAAAKPAAGARENKTSTPPHSDEHK